MKQLILYFLVIFSFSSCNLIPFPHSENIDYTYSNEKKPDFRSNDTIYFKNTDTNQKDSFVLSIFSDFHVNDNISYDQATYHYILITENPLYSDINIYFTNIDYKESILYEKNRQTAKVGYEKKKTITYCTLSGQIYSSVDVFFNPDSTNADFIPNTIYFSCKYGILRYEYLDGRVFELMSK